MQYSDLPTKFPIPFGEDAGGSYIRPIPEASQIGIQNGAASLETGFPPLNATPLGAGGVPPFMQDMNGILKQITQWSQWQNAGGTVQFDSDFSTAVGGYPMGAVLQSAVNPALFWVSIADDNTTDPDSISSANWVAQGGNTSSRIITAAGPQAILASDVNVFVKQTVPAAIQLNLLAVPVIQEVTIFDDLGDADSHNITISGNGKLIGSAVGAIPSIVLNQPFQAITLIWRASATQWRIKASN